jgi:hypothetical protein
MLLHPEVLMLQSRYHQTRLLLEAARDTLATQVPVRHKQRVAARQRPLRIIGPSAWHIQRALTAQMTA